MKIRGAQSYRKAVLSHWMGLELPRFSCGHEKTPGNTYRFQNKNRHGNVKERTRCKRCHETRRKH